MASPKRKTENKLSLRQVAERLGENLETVRTWRKAGRFPHAELITTIRGDVWLIPEHDVQRFKRPSVGRPRKVTNRLNGPS